jgi:hypothetical protein
VFPADIFLGVFVMITAALAHTILLKAPEDLRSATKAFHTAASLVMLKDRSMRSLRSVSFLRYSNRSVKNPI